MPNPQPHYSPSDCGQTQTFAQIEATLRRLDAHGERTAVALEHIAEQGAMVAGHEKRLDKHDLDFREMFNRINDQSRLEKVEAKVHELEKKLAGEEAAEELEAQIQARIEADDTIKKKFWTDVKVRMITPATAVLFFAIWLIDKWDLVLKLKMLMAEFKG